MDPSLALKRGDFEVNPLKKLGPGDANLACALFRAENWNGEDPRKLAGISCFVRFLRCAVLSTRVVVSRPPRTCLINTLSFLVQVAISQFALRRALASLKIAAASFVSISLT